VPLISQGLRLKGRADRISRKARNQFELRDYKTGSVTTDDGQVKEEVALQLRCYGLMFLEKYPGAAVSLVVDSGDEYEVTFDEKAQNLALVQIQTILERMPPPTEVEMGKAATPGPGCWDCRVRHACRPYQTTAPQWWGSYPVGKDRIPKDTWGTLVDVKLETEGVGITLVDTAGRRVRVNGLDNRHGIERTRARKIWLFDLESSGPSHGFNGTMFHPRVFHELPRDRRERRAWSARVFEDD
jgi:hypothetical protein